MNNANTVQQRSRWDVAMDAVYLMSCALHGAVPDLERVGDLDALFHYCNNHSITAMVAMALESAWRITPPEDVAASTPWKQAKEKAIRKNILLNAERERILSYLDSIGCWYMPLKGSFLQHDYPKFGMRQMSDNDILYDASFTQQVYEFMCGSGYTAKSFGKFNHDEYTKAPVYNFEMHRNLFSQLAGKAIFDYYLDAQRLFMKDVHNQCGYHLSHEDFYVYMIAHAYKHFYQGGTGIRSLVDVYVFVDKHGENMDWDYAEGELEKLGVLDYDRQCRSIAQKLFGQVSEVVLAETENEFLSKFLDAGTYGNKQQMVENALDRMEKSGSSGGLVMKMRYFWDRLLPPLEFMAVLEPDLQEHPWKLPLAYIRRLFRAVFLKPMRVIREVTYLAKSKRSAKDK